MAQTFYKIMNGKKRIQKNVKYSKSEAIDFLKQLQASNPGYKRGQFRAVATGRGSSTKPDLSVE